jgi:hypothetical protein
MHSISGGKTPESRTSFSQFPDRRFRVNIVHQPDAKHLREDVGSPSASARAYSDKGL